MSKNQPAKVIASWYFEQDEGFGGAYPQVSGNSSSEIFRDTYRRCLAVFFSSAIRAYPESNLVLYLNKPWSEESSEVASRCWALFNELGVDIRIIDFNSVKLAQHNTWKNQFFVLDILQDLASKCASDDLVLLLDSDIVWLKPNSNPDVWDKINKDGYLLMEISYSKNQIINNSSREELTRFYEKMQATSSTQTLKYFGGELVGFTGNKLRELSKVIATTAGDIQVLLAQKSSQRFNALSEEAYFLSYCYKVLGYENPNAQKYIKRIWTMFSKPKNVSDEDLKLQLWHLPAEKNYGIRRIYSKYLMHSSTSSELDLICENPEILGRLLGIPRNSIKKIFQDTFYAIMRRINKKLGRI